MIERDSISRWTLVRRLEVVSWVFGSTQEVDAVRRLCEIRSWLAMVCWDVHRVIVVRSSR